MAGIGSHEETSCTFKDDENPWEVPIVLSLDGGGIRGLSSLLILKELFKEVARLDQHAEAQHDENDDGMVARPCHYFDHMVGTSTGGLISVILGRKRLPVQEAINVYVRFASKVFGRSPYSATALEKVMKRVLEKHCEHSENCKGENELMMQSDHEPGRQRRCMTSVVANKRHNGPAKGPWIFRSYDHIVHEDSRLGDSLNPGYTNHLNPDVKIWEVARATTAAPGYFSPMKIGDNMYMDGGVGANNPSDLAWHNARQISLNPTHRIAIFISVGTGKRTEQSRFSPVTNLWALFKYGKQKLSDTEKVHEFMEGLINSQAEPKTLYSRLNVDRGLTDMKLNEWKTISGKKQALRPRTKTGAQISRINSVDEMPILLNRDIEYEGKRLLKKGYEYPTLDRIEENTGKYLRQSYQKNHPGAAERIQACAKQLVDAANARRESDLIRWRYFIGDHVEYRQNPNKKTNR